MREICSHCGGAMKRGLLRSSSLIYWTEETEPALYAPSKKSGDVIPPGASRWMGSDCPALYCEACGLILISTKEDEKL